jgi:serine/threonine-protein kinase
MGTPYYMSPEQTRGIRTLDHRSDLWALAVITFQCVCGRLPFQSDSLGDLIFKIGTDPLPVPSHVTSDIPAHFDQWWLRAAQRDPANRFQTAKEFCDALAMSLGVTQGGALTGGSGAYSGSGVSTGASPSGGWGTSQAGPAQSGGWGGSQSGPLSPTGGSVSPAQSSAGVMPTHSSGAVIGGLPVGPTGPLTGSSGITANSGADKGSRKGGAGMIVGIVGAVAVVGAIGYTVATRGSHGASAQPSVVTPSPEVPSADPAPKPTTTAPVVAPSATAMVPVTSAQSPPPPDPHVPPVKTGPVTKVPPKPTATAATAPVVTAHTPTKTVPNDGI